MSFNRQDLPSSYRQEGAVYTGVYLGLVRANADPQRMGRIAVWVSEFGPDREEYWITVSYASPFAGATPVNNNTPDGITLKDTQQSYGWWATPPDIDNQVLVCFLNGDMTKGFYFACLYAQNMNHMVPGLSFGKSTDAAMDQKFSPYGPPVAEYNKKTKNGETVTSTTATGQDTASVRRPVFTPLADGLLQQGLQQDPERGPANTSARRESPSNVFGYSSPRGNSIHVDDGYRASPSEEPTNEFIRFRTRSGAQILIHETSGYIYMITKGGNSWVEISDKGIDMYSSGAISMATNSDFNVVAGGSINLSSGANINLRSGTLSSYTKNSTNFHADGDFLAESGADMFFTATKNFGIVSGKSVGVEAEGDILMAACGIISRNAKGILDNSGGGMPEQASPVKYTSSEIASRIPTHEPFDHDSSLNIGGATGLDANGRPITSVVDGSGNVYAAPAAVPASLRKRANQLYCKLKARGLKDVQIAAVLGVWQQESTLNSNAEEGGSAGQGVGLAQWSRDRLRGGGWGPGRKAKLFAYASQQGKSWKDTDLQLDFFMAELKGSESRAGSVLLSATTLDQAIQGMKLYERFGVAGRRVAYARAYEAEIKAGKYSC